MALVFAWASIGWLLSYVAHNSFVACGIYHLIASVVIFVMVMVGRLWQYSDVYCVFCHALAAFPTDPEIVVLALERRTSIACSLTAAFEKMAAMHTSMAPLLTSPAPSDIHHWN